MLAAAVVLGFVSFLCDLERIHLGHGPIPAWVPFALDASIAGGCGGFLTLGARYLEEEIPESATAPPGFVVVAKPVWEDLQKEVVSIRGPHRAEPMVREPVTAPAAGPVPAAPVSLPNPWDEGPPSPPATHPVPPPATARPAPVGKPVPAAPAPEPELTQAQLEDIARMGGILGIVPRKGETGREYSNRLAEAREALAASTPSLPPPPTQPAPKPAPPVAKPASHPEPAPVPKSADPATDIDELMVWLEKMVEDPPGGPVVPGAKKAPPKDPVDESKKDPWIE